MRTLLCLGLGFFVGFRIGKLEGKLQEKARQNELDENLFKFVKQNMPPSVTEKLTQPPEELN